MNYETVPSRKFTAMDENPQTAKGPGRPRDEEVRRRILDSAAQLLEKACFDEISVDAIAERSGAGKATIYRWWPNKAAVLIEAFRATLEEVIEADIILHVRHCAHEDWEAQNDDVNMVLGELGIEGLRTNAAGETRQRVYEVWNKVDLIEPEKKRALVNAAGRRSRHGHPIIISALSGEGIDELLTALAARLAADQVVFDLIPIPVVDEVDSRIYRAVLYFPVGWNVCAPSPRVLTQIIV